MKTGKRTHARIVREISFYLALFSVTSLLLLPAVVALGTSFKPTREIFTRAPSIIPRQITLASYEKLLGVPEFPRYVMNSLVVAGFNSLIVIVAAMPAAYALSFFRFRGCKIVSQMILATYMFPAITLVVPIFFLADRLHLLDSYWILILTNLSFSLPISIWLLHGFLGKFPVELEKAARVDGCSHLQVIRHVILPIMTPGVTAVGAFAFILSWGEYLFSMTLTLTDSRRTVSAGLLSLMGNYRIDYGLLTAAGTLIVVPVIILFVLFEKYIVSGLTSGSLKD